MNILFTSAGRRVSLIQAFHKEAALLSKNHQIFTADSNPELSSACQLYGKYFKVPIISSQHYVNALMEIALRNKIKLIIPTIDDELSILSESKMKFKENGIDVLISDLELIRNCRDKRKTHQLFNKKGIKTAKYIDRNSPTYPIFVKPFDGSGSKDTQLIKNSSQMTDSILNNKNLMFLEYLDLKEYVEFTVDLYYDRNSELKCIVPRERIEVRDGEVTKGITRKNHFLPFIKERFSNLSGVIGCINIQFFNNISTNDIIGIEINPRFGGGYPLSYFAGANFPRWIIEEYFFNKKIEYFDKWEENLLMLRYDEEVFVHDSKS